MKKIRFLIMPAILFALFFACASVNDEHFVIENKSPFQVKLIKDTQDRPVVRVNNDNSDKNKELVVEAGQRLSGIEIAGELSQRYIPHYLFQIEGQPQLFSAQSKDNIVQATNTLTVESPKQLYLLDVEGAGVQPGSAIIVVRNASDNAVSLFKDDDTLSIIGKDSFLISEGSETQPGAALFALSVAEQSSWQSFGIGRDLTDKDGLKNKSVFQRLKITLAANNVYVFTFTGQREVVFDRSYPLHRAADPPTTWRLALPAKGSIKAVIANTASDGYYIAGSLFRAQDELEVAYIAALDNDGAVLKTQTFALDPEGVPKQSRINALALADGKLYAAGTYQRWNSVGGEFSAAGWLVGMDAETLTVENEQIIDAAVVLNKLASNGENLLVGGETSEPAPFLYSYNLDCSPSPQPPVGEIAGEIVDIVYRRQSDDYLAAVNNAAANPGAIYTVASDGQITGPATVAARLVKLLPLENEIVVLSNTQTRGALWRLSGTGNDMTVNQQAVDGVDSRFIKGWYNHRNNSISIIGNMDENLTLFSIIWEKNNDERITPAASTSMQKTFDRVRSGTLANDFGYLVVHGADTGDLLVHYNSRAGLYADSGETAIVETNNFPGIAGVETAAVSSVRVENDGELRAKVTWNNSRGVTSVRIEWGSKENTAARPESSEAVYEDSYILELADGIEYRVSVIPLNGSNPKKTSAFSDYRHDVIRHGDGFATFKSMKSAAADSISVYHDRDIAAFRIASSELPHTAWREIYDWAGENGYQFVKTGGPANAVDTVEDTGELPVAGISWLDAVVWCNAASERYGYAPVYVDNNGEIIKSSTEKTIPQLNEEADGLRLPSLIEWQYAVIGGSTNIWATSADPWYNNEGAKTVLDGAAHNELYHLSGNIAEWTWFAVDEDAAADRLPLVGGSYRSRNDEQLITHTYIRNDGVRVYTEDTDWHNFNAAPVYAGFRPARTEVKDPDHLLDGYDSVNMLHVDRVAVDRVAADYGYSLYLAECEISWGEWNSVREWAQTNGYRIDAGQSGSAAGVDNDQPVTNISWLDALAWCNAKSELSGLEPVYEYQGQPLRSADGDININYISVKDASGYRLPTGREWEFAAYGGDTAVEGSTVTEGRTSQVKESRYMAAFSGHIGMIGNAEEWCYDNYGSGRQMVRGGSSSNPHSQNREEYHKINWIGSFSAKSRNRYRGFRIARRFKLKR